MKFEHICEVCDKTELLDSETAFNNGWDYPPRTGSFGVISARTCENCPITKTLWWELTINMTDINDLSSKHKETLTRILKEPEMIASFNFDPK